MFFKGEHTVSGAGQLSDEMKAAGAPPSWNTYVTEDDVEAVAKRMEAAGGTSLLSPMKVMDAGWMAWFLDPEGAAFAVWKADQHIGSQRVNEPGALCWNALATRDIAKASEFYGNVLGWSIVETDIESSGSSVTYHMIRVGDRDIGGILQMNEQWEGIPPHWMVYTAVEDVRANVEKVRATGGAVHVEPTRIPPGIFAVVADPQGATFTVMQMTQFD